MWLVLWIVYADINCKHTLEIREKSIKTAALREASIMNYSYYYTTVDAHFAFYQPREESQVRKTLTMLL